MHKQNSIKQYLCYPIILNMTWPYWLSNPFLFFMWVFSRDKLIVLLFSSMLNEAILFVSRYCQFHQHYLLAIFVRNIGAKNFKPKIQLSYKILAPKTRFRMKNARLKCWWNWHLIYPIHVVSVRSTNEAINTVYYSRRYFLKEWIRFIVKAFHCRDR